MSESGSTQNEELSKEQKEVSLTASDSKQVGPDTSGQNASRELQASSQSSKHVREQQTEKTGLAWLFQFLNDVLQELKKINWPDRKQVLRETLSVIVLVTLITGCVLGFDYAIAKAVFEPLDKFARQMGGGIGVHR